MADTDKIHVHMLQTLLPLFRVVSDVLIHRITRRGMDQQKSMIAQSQITSHRHLSQPSEMLIIQNFEVSRSHRG